jgi:hypothetical protein
VVESNDVVVSSNTHTHMQINFDPLNRFRSILYTSSHIYIAKTLLERKIAKILILKTLLERWKCVFLVLYSTFIHEYLSLYIMNLISFQYFELFKKMSSDKDKKSG